MGKNSFELIGTYTSNNNTYDIFADIKKINKLINDIVEKVGYKEEGDYILTSDSSVDLAIDKINRANLYGQTVINYFPSATPELPNYEPLYRNITSFSVRNTGYGKVIDFHGQKVVAPKLAKILEQIILYADEESIKQFLDYPQEEEIIPIDQQIDSIYGESIKGANKEEINKLASLISAKAKGEYFNAELLKEYYALACKMIKLSKTKENVYTI